MNKPNTNIGVVVIGRNEGERLKRCITSLINQHMTSILYVDSGSTDGSIEYAKSRGVDVVNLDTSVPFTMARGRNAGFAHLLELSPDIPYVQFVDGDCEVDDQWISHGLGFISQHKEVACVCGYRVEKYSNASIYNHMIDLEWQGNIGEVDSCGGDAIYRVDTFGVPADSKKE